MAVKYKILFFIILEVFTSVHGIVIDIPIQMVSTEDVAEWDQINEELKQLKDLKNRYKASAARHEDDANRWQFQNNLSLEARKAYQQAEFDREMERQIQGRIDYLQSRQVEILKEHPEFQGPLKG